MIKGLFSWFTTLNNSYFIKIFLKINFAFWYRYLDGHKNPSYLFWFKKIKTNSCISSPRESPLVLSGSLHFGKCYFCLFSHCLIINKSWNHFKWCQDLFIVEQCMILLCLSLKPCKNIIFKIHNFNGHIDTTFLLLTLTDTILSSGAFGAERNCGISPNF